MEHKEIQKEWAGYRLHQCLVMADSSTEKPQERQGHVLVEIRHDGQYFLFGGRGNTKKQERQGQRNKKERQQRGPRPQRVYLNDTWILDLQQDNGGVSWQQLPCGPGPRWSSAGFYYQDSVYIHGGRSLDCFHDDLWRFCLQEKRWEQIKMTGGDMPPPVNGHSLVQYHDKAFLFGGSSSPGRERNYVDDVYILDLKTFSWEKAAITDPKPSPRYWHSVTTTTQKGDFYLVGGFAFMENGKSCYYDDVWRFDLEQLVWTRIWLTGRGFQELNRCGLAPVDSVTLAVFGGNYFEPRRRAEIFLSNLVLVNVDLEIIIELPCIEGTPLAVGHHSFLRMAGHQPNFLVFGGEDGKRRFSDVMILSLVEKT